MARITIIDDDFGLEILAENLGYLGHEVRRIGSAEEALKALDDIVASDLIVLDIIMPRGANIPGIEVSGGRTTGMTLFNSVRKRKANLPILAYTATNDADVVKILSQSAHTTFLSKWSTPSIDEVISAIEKLLGIKRPKQLPQVFIVHGNDEQTKLAVKNYLQNTLKLPEPIILHEQAHFGRTLIEKFEYYSGRSQLAFVILTPDDQAADPNAADDAKRRARQNVIFELGYFLGTLGRSSGKVILLFKGPLELPSDLSGVVYIDIGKGVEAAGEAIRKELAHVI